MARDLGYGGVANTNGPRNFSGKETAVAIVSQSSYVGSGLASGIGFRSRKRELLWWAFTILKKKESIYVRNT